MGSYAVHEFLGEGVLKEITQKLADDGWDDVPTLKMMQAEDMEAIDLTDPQRDALELRIYLHDRSLMEYADKIEASGKNLPDLLITSPVELMSQFGMRKADVSRFTDRSLACGIKMPPNHPLKARTGVVAPFHSDNVVSTEAPEDSTTAVVHSKLDGCDLDADQLKENKKFASPGSLNNEMYAQILPSTANSDGFQPPTLLRPLGDSKQSGESKGIFKAEPSIATCGLGTGNDRGKGMTKLSVLENIVLRKLAPVHKAGADADQQRMKMPTPFKASELWVDKPTLIFCLRRPGCIMCRGEAHQLYARKPIFDAMGVQLVVVLNEHIESEVRAFWPHYWAGTVLLDENREFFKALGGGKLRKGNLLTGFVFSPRAILNWKRAKATGIQYNTIGEGLIKGGLYILGSGKTGVLYQFIEKEFGDWAPLDEVFKVCQSL
ncbi:unnamed protein product [Sphagnum balticum]